MAAQPIDYAALAEQARKPAPIDYAALAEQARKATAPAETLAPEGFFHSLGSSVGVTPEIATQNEDDFKAHPVIGTIKAAAGPALPAAQSLYEGAKRSGGELLQAGREAFNRNKAGALYHSIMAIPIVGPALDKAADQYAEGNTAGEMGTLVGATAQSAPAVLGAVDMAAPGRPTLPTPSLPSRAKAGSVFNDLNAKLADHPVQLKDTIAPLQRAAEIGVRGGSLPKPVADLLQRSQAIEPMTFPEARDYQMALSDLSRADLESLTPRMKGQIAQVNKALFTDIYQSAEGKQPGLGTNYADAMKEFRQASQIVDTVKKTGKIAARYAIPAALGGGLIARYGSELIPK